MYGTEIQTSVKHDIKIIYIVVNNSYYGTTYFNNKNNINIMSAIPTHNWCEFAKSLGLNSCIVKNPNKIRVALIEAINSRKSFLIDVHCSHKYSTPVEKYREQVRKSGVL